MKWTLVTGGSKRLGAKICESLAGQGMPILVHYRHSVEDAKGVAAACRKRGVDAELIQGDFSTLESTLRFAAECHRQFPEIKTLINNVGNYLVKPATATSPEEWNAVFQTNLHAPFTLCREFLQSLRRCQGNIVNIGVVGVGNVHADVHRTAYTASKMGLWMLTKSLARELAADHVRVNMVSPGYIENAVDMPISPQNLPMGRPASFNDVISAITFLLSDENSYITGQNIEVGGGLGLIH